MSKKSFELPIGIFGGTFDPIHLGHIQAAKFVFDQLLFKEIHFIPCFDPPHRAAPIAKPEARLEMVKIALQDYPYFVADDREMKRQGKSYMVDTLRSLRLEFSDALFCLILGYDAFAKLSTWYHWELLEDYAHFVVLSRPQVPAGMSFEMQQFLNQHQTNSFDDLCQYSAGKVYILEMPVIPISATQIRNQLVKGQRPKELDGQVYQYIMKNGVYGKCG